MPLVRCPDCSAVVAHRGKRLAFPCPGEHPDTRRPPTLDVDRDWIEPNGHDIDAHRPTYDAPRDIDTERGLELVAENLARRRQD